MEKRYQVFVSSTFRDLQNERREVMQALLELDCFPAGMELFPAANETQWELIKGVIDQSDYYIVIVAGRYGSMAEDGISYTEKEYQYALEKGIPILGFLHEDVSEIAGKHLEPTTHGKERLEAFRREVERRHCKYYSNASDLGSKVSRGLVQLIKRHPAIGWIRGDQIASSDAKDKIIDLQTKIENYRQTGSNESSGEGNIDNALQCLTHKYCLRYYAKIDDGLSALRIRETFNKPLTWIFWVLGSAIAVQGTIDAHEARAILVRFLENYIEDHRRPGIYLNKPEITIPDASLLNLIIALKKQGLIASNRNGMKTYYSLTMLGIGALERLHLLKEDRDAQAASTDEKAENKSEEEKN